MYIFHAFDVSHAWSGLYFGGMKETLSDKGLREKYSNTMEIHKLTVRDLLVFFKL